jgi:hypothetical protein
MRKPRAAIFLLSWTISMFLILRRKALALICSFAPIAGFEKTYVNVQHHGR